MGLGSWVSRAILASGSARTYHRPYGSITPEMPFPAERIIGKPSSIAR